MLAVIGLGEAHEAAVGRLAEERVGAGEIDVVGDQHHRAGRHGRVDSEPAALVEDQLVDADAGERLQHRPHGGGVSVLVIMRAASEHAAPARRRSAGHDFAGMAGDAALRKAGQVGIGNADRLFDLVGQRRRGPSPAPWQSSASARRAARPADFDRGPSFQDVACETVGQHVAHRDRLDHAGLVAEIEFGVRPQ